MKGLVLAATVFAATAFAATMLSSTIVKAMEPAEALPSRDENKSVCELERKLGFDCTDASDAKSQTRGGRNQATTARGKTRGVQIKFDDQPSEPEAAPATTEPVSCKLSYNITFLPGSSRVPAGSVASVNKVAQILLKHQEIAFNVVGHTDANGFRNLPPELWSEENRALSGRRAAAVRDLLMSFGAPANRVKAEGRGQSQPDEGLDPRDARNRRVEFEKPDCQS